MILCASAVTGQGKAAHPPILGKEAEKVDYFAYCHQNKAI
jgi:hypothetical protein